MRVDICNPDDETSVQHLKDALSQLNVVGVDKSWAIGVDVLKLQIGKELLTVFSDAWSIDIEGPESLVQEVVRLIKRNDSSSSA